VLWKVHLFATNFCQFGHCACARLHSSLNKIEFFSKKYNNINLKSLFKIFCRLNFSSFRVFRYLAIDLKHNSCYIVVRLITNYWIKKTISSQIVVYQVSILRKFYNQLCCTKVIWATFLELQFGFEFFFFLAQENWHKIACKNVGEIAYSLTKALWDNAHFWSKCANRARGESVAPYLRF